ncbi:MULTISPECIES: NUDIX domain-containing protein [Kitasatospora]|uniref:NUDIX domain-containing protein n=1 Tax=Kitasatospora TaxID=2063 RepID=UPI0002F43208|nr:NUDIX domain-containing protein [Kitasatospora setae]
MRLAETAAPALSAEHEAAMDRMWEKAAQANPSLFDGPAVVCTALEQYDRQVELSWARTTYRRFALRRVPGAPVVSSVFVSVAQPVEDGRLVIGRMSGSTAAPGRWQLPGGNVEPPQPGTELDETELRRQGVKELAEEVGITAAPDQLTLLAITRGENGNIGVHYLAPALSEKDVHEKFAALVASELSRGSTPELDELTLAAFPGELESAVGQHVDYLAPLLERYAAWRSDE